MGEDEILEEAVQLSEAVLSEGRSYFEREYNGELEPYMIVKDIRNRIEVATLDSGEMVYPEDIPDLEELGGLEAARVLRDKPLEPGDYRKVFEDQGVVEVEDGEVRYNRDSFAYFLLFDEAERLIEGYSEGTEEELENEEPVAETEEISEEGEYREENSGAADQEENEGDVEDKEPEESRDKVEELESIWQDVSSE